ncbi:MAG: phage portal protein [Fibrobacter sp.]|nr:phage portal protein [Fibrobacter sp.]
MYTFQNLLEVGESDQARGKFCRDAVKAFKESADYQAAKAGDSYYNKHNTTIEKYQKYLYTVSGNQIADIYSSNYKLKTLFFRRLVTQQVQYVLGNGVTLQNIKNKEKLGKDFDFKLQMAAKRAMASGRAFGFWNFDHLEVFGYADHESQPGFCPLYSETTAQLEAGIRFWSKAVGDKIIERYTLYEADGITEYRFIEDEMELVQEKHGYITTTKRTPAGGVEEVTEENYGALPIVPLYVNDTHDSELIGIRESVDCYDFVKSGLANDIDDMSGFYWILQNSGGMEDTDLAQFIQRMKTVRAATVEDADQVTSHTQEVPTEARRLMLELLRKDIYEDFQALDVNTLSAAAKTTQEIQAAYQAQDNKCADFEYYLIEFVENILELAGIDDVPTFVWNRVVNQAEQTNMILSAGTYLSEEAVIKHLPFLTPEEADEEVKKRAEQAYNQFNDNEDDEEE